MALLLDLLSVVQHLHAILLGQSFLGFNHLVKELGIRFPPLQREVCADLLDRTESLHHQDGVMSHDGAAAFTDNDRMRHFFRVANIDDVVDDVPSILVERIVH